MIGFAMTGGAVWWSVRDSAARARGDTSTSDLKNAAAEAAKPHPEAFETLVSLLSDEDPDVRRSALNALGPRGENAASVLIAHIGKGDDIILFGLFARRPSTVRSAPLAIATGLGHESRSVRWSAAKALARIGADAAPAARMLAAHLDESDKFAAPEIVNALANIGEPAIEPLRDALASGSARVRARAMDALSRIDNDNRELEWSYYEHLSSPDADERIAAAIALARSGEYAQYALPVLDEALRSDDWRRYEHVFVALRQYEGHAADTIAMLFRFVALDARSGQERVPRDIRSEAIYQALNDTIASLGALAPGALAEGLGHKSSAVRADAVRVLKQAKPDAVPGLLAETRSAAPIARAHAVYLLATVAPADARVAPAIARALTDDAWQVRAAGAAAIWRTRRDARASLPILLEALRQFPAYASAELKAQIRMANELRYLLKPFDEYGEAARFAEADLRKFVAEAPNTSVRSAAQKALAALNR